ncbi:50S ribosomal protein L10 [Erysipelothrix aquatica]|uniref:50S ribosomal protein L10 n=1 Tax=Erysipelothrix aquatica TaxID=2683714 RepID=UPI001357EE8F|nr:50S ribosomal protein L10 [Erysipelothrix aquatica]
MRNEVLENKKAVVAEIQDKVKNSASSIIVEYHGLDVGQITTLRRQLREEGIEFKVYKNKLFQRAVEGTEFEGLKDELVGPNAVAFGTDAVAPSRVLAQFAKKNKKLVLKAGVVDGNIVNAEEIKELSALPNHDGMISMLLGMFQSPIRSFAYAVSQVAEQRAEAEGVVVEETAAEAVAEEATEEVAAEAVVEETTEA